MEVVAQFNKMPDRQFQQRATIICGFAGVGKSFFTRNIATRPANYINLVVEDIDSSAFSKLPDRGKNPAWPSNYMSFISERSKIADVIMTATHAEVRQALLDHNLQYTLVYPDKHLKEDYLARYRARNSPKWLVDMFDAQWNSFIAQCQGQKGCRHVVLQKGQYVADVIDKLLEKDGEDEVVD